MKSKELPHRHVLAGLRSLSGAAPHLNLWRLIASGMTPGAAPILEKGAYG
jgi:hypothetical protein